MMNFSANEGQQALDSALARLTRGEKGFFLIFRNQNPPHETLFLGEGRKAYAVKLRLDVRTLDGRQVWNEGDLEHRLILFRGNKQREPFFILADDKWNCCASSFDPGTSCQLIALMTRLNPSAQQLKMGKEDEIPYAVNARFDSQDSGHPVAVMALVHDEQLAQLWDYEAELIQPSRMPSTAQAATDEKEEADELGYPEDDQILHW